MAGNTLTSSLVVRLIDQVTGPAKGISRALLGIEKAASGGTFGSRLGDAIERNNRALDNARAGLFDAVAGFYALKTALVAPISSAVKFESAMADVAKVSGFDTAGLEAYGKRLRQLAVSEIPMAVDDLAALSAAAAAAGVPDEDLFDFTRTTAKAAVAWEMTGAQAGEALAKIRTALGLTNEQTAAFADAINYVSDSTASSAPDLIDFSKRVASQGEFYGYTKEQTLAFGAAMISAGAESEVAATSFRNMGKALTRGASATKAQRKAYKALGLDATKVAKAMQKDAVGTTLKVIEKLGQLPEHMQAATLSDLFGDEARALAPLLNDVEQLRKALALTADEQKYLNSVGKEFEKRAATSAYKLQRFKSQLNDIALTVGGALLPALTGMLEPLGEIALKFSAWAEANPELVRNIIMATSALIGFRVALAGLRFVGLLGRGGALSMLALGYNTVGKAAIAARTAIGSMWALQTALAAGRGYGGMAKLVDAAKALVLIIPGLNLVGPAIAAIGTALGTITLPVVAGIAAVAAVGFALYKYWDRMSSVFTGVARAVGEQLAPAFDRIKPYFEWLAPIGNTIAAGWDRAKQALSDFAGWLGSFFSREALSEEQKAQWEKAGYEAATRMIEQVKAVVQTLVDWFSSLPDKIIAAIGSIDISSLIKWPTPPAWLSRLWGGEGINVPAPEATYDANGNVTGHRKAGGPIWPGGSFLVGEDGPEVITPKSGANVTPMGKIGGGGLSVGQIGPFHIGGGGSAAETAQAVARAVEDKLREMLRGAHADMGARA